MPYELKKAKGGYYVITQGSDKKHSKKPLTKEMAERQMRALYFAMGKGSK